MSGFGNIFDVEIYNFESESGLNSEKKYIVTKENKKNSFKSYS